MSHLDVIERVAKSRGLAVSVVRGRSRHKYVCRVRHEAMYMLRLLLGLSYPDIARALWRMDHTTAMHGVWKIGAEVADHPEYETELRAMVTP